jgi:hypothetical protein
MWNKWIIILMRKHLLLHNFIALRPCSLRWREGEKKHYLPITSIKSSLTRNTIPALFICNEENRPSVHRSTRSTFFTTNSFSSGKCQSLALVLCRVFSITSMIGTGLLFSISLFSRWSGPGRTSFRRRIRPRRKHHWRRTWCL